MNDNTYSWDTRISPFSIETTLLNSVYSNQSNTINPSSPSFAIITALKLVMNMLAKTWSIEMPTFNLALNYNKGSMNRKRFISNKHAKNILIRFPKS